MTTEIKDHTLTEDVLPDPVKRMIANRQAFIAEETERLKKLQEVPVVDPPPQAVETPAEPVDPPKEEPVQDPPPAEEKVETPKEDPPPPAEPKVVDPKEESRVKVLDGMLKKQGRDLRAERAEKAALAAENEALKERLAAAGSAEFNPPKATPAAPVVEDDSEFVETFDSVLGAQTLARLEARLEAKFAKKFAPQDAVEKIRGEVGNVARVAASTSLERFEQELDGLVSNWRELNVDPDFNERIKVEHAHTGMSVKEVLQKKHAELDAHRVAALFLEYAPDPVTPKAAVPATPAAPKLDKAKLVAPRSTPAAARPVNEGPEKVKLSEKAQLAEDIRAGKYDSADPEQHKKLRAELATRQARLNEALRTGNFIPG